MGTSKENLSGTRLIRYGDIAGLRMCSVLEPEGTGRNGSIPRSRDGSDPVFGSDKIEERNGSVFFSVGGIRSGTE